MRHHAAACPCANACLVSLQWVPHAPTQQKCLHHSRQSGFVSRRTFQGSSRMRLPWPHRSSQSCYVSSVAERIIKSPSKAEEIVLKASGERGSQLAAAAVDQAWRNSRDLPKTARREIAGAAALIYGHRALINEPLWPWIESHVHSRYASCSLKYYEAAGRTYDDERLGMMVDLIRRKTIGIMIGQAARKFLGLKTVPNKELLPSIRLQVRLLDKDDGPSRALPFLVAKCKEANTPELRTALTQELRPAIDRWLSRNPSHSLNRWLPNIPK